MKLLSSLHAAVLAVLLIGSLSPSRAAVTDFTFLNGLSGANEIPVNASSGSYTINTLRFDDSVGTFGSFSVVVDFAGLQGGANNAHIHGLAPVGVNGGTLQGLSYTAASSGTISGAWLPVSSAQVTGLFAGQTYINIHSTSVGGGEWRGQLIPLPANVPEPSTWALVGAGALGLLYRRRRRA